MRVDDGLQIALIGQNLTEDIACTSRYAQPNNAGLGLVNSVQGGTALRCVVTPPRTISLKATWRVCAEAAGVATRAAKAWPRSSKSASRPGSTKLTD